MKQRLLTLALTLFAASSYAVIPPSASTSASLAPMLEKVMPAVVNISIQGEMLAAPDKDDPEDVPPNGKRKFSGIGSGVIMDAKKGFVITNAHVIKDASAITVTLNDGRRLKAKLIGADPSSDVAILQILADKLIGIPQADSNKVRVGDFVVAIGNPFGLNLYGTNQTATSGIVSALQRSDIKSEGLESYIQTDAAINPGNSGGALINMQGELIGINTAIISPYGGNVGIGLAIPANTARDVMDQIIKFGSVHRGLMGVFVQHLTPELAQAIGSPDAKGALVTQVNPSSPAEAAGLKPGDIIQKINNQSVTDAAQVKNIIGLLRVGSGVSLQILRNGKAVTLSAHIDDVKQHQEQLQAQNPFLFGLALKNFNEESPMHGHIKGVQIVGALENSAPWRSGVRPGDVIVSANQKPVTNLNQLQTAVNGNNKQLLLHVLRGPGSIFLVVQR